MKVLIVASGNWKSISPFVEEQVRSLSAKNIEIEYYLIRGKKHLGYLGNYLPYIRTIKRFNPDIIHAHYGLSGLFAVLQRAVPVVITFHGSDINDKKIFPYSKLAMRLSAYNIFVSQQQIKKAKPDMTKSAVIPCGIDLGIFAGSHKKDLHRSSPFENDKKIIVFSSNFDNPVKNYTLAKQAVDVLGDQIQLIELKGYSRPQVNDILNFSDVALMTSFNEGSPQFIKEAMACNCPIVSTKVGDVEWVLGETKGCYLTSFDPLDVAEKIRLSFAFGMKTKGRDRIIKLGLDSETIAQKIHIIYSTILGEK